MNANLLARIRAIPLPDAELTEDLLSEHAAIRARAATTLTARVRKRRHDLDAAIEYSQRRALISDVVAQVHGRRDD